MRKRIYLCVLAGVLTLETGAVTVQAAELDLPVAAEKNITKLTEGEDTTAGELGDMDNAADHTDSTIDSTADHTDEANDTEDDGMRNDTVDPADQEVISSGDAEQEVQGKDSEAEDQEEKTEDSEAEETFEEEIFELDTYNAGVHRWKRL